MLVADQSLIAQFAFIYIYIYIRKKKKRKKALLILISIGRVYTVSDRTFSGIYVSWKQLHIFCEHIKALDTIKITW